MREKEKKGKKLEASIGICAHNEEHNISVLLDALLRQKTRKCVIKEILVVSSGCNDQTNSIVKRFNKKDKRIRLLVQKRKKGKVSAINIILKKASSNIIVLENADTIPYPDTIDNLTKPFFNKNIGLAGAKPVIVNPVNSFFGFTNHLLWSIHHQLGLQGLKVSELIAFRRKLVRRIPENVSGDEGFIETMIKQQGYSSRYVSSARFYLKGPDNLKDFINQRRRCYAIQLSAKNNFSYQFPTSNRSMLKLIKMGFKFKYDNKFKFVIWAFGAFSLELFARLLGSYDYYAKKKIYCNWNSIKSTKKLV